MILKEVLDKTTQFFKDKKFESARLDSEMLISSALGLKRIELYLKYEQPLQESEVASCRELVRRRAQGEPIAYILGRKSFYHLTFLVDSRVLIPRPETETLVETVLNSIKNMAPLNSPPTREDKIQVLDLGCGSGCIGLSVAYHEPRAFVTLVDSSAGAVAVARANVEALGLQQRTQIFEQDVRQVSQVDSRKTSEWDLANQKYDFILANPPYISRDDKDVQENVRKFEPSTALFAEQGGLSDIFEWSTRFVNHLAPHGIMIFEIGHLQGPVVKSHFEELKAFQKIEIIKDMSGMDRFVLGQSKGSSNG